MEETISTESSETVKLFAWYFSKSINKETFQVFQRFIKIALL